jgi:transcriptional regulator with XRE-family HTH domain
MPKHEKLKKLRQSKNWSQLFVADKLYISQNAYSLIGSGKTKLDAQRMLQLSKIFGVHPIELLEEEGEYVNLSDIYKKTEVAGEPVISKNNDDLIKHLITQLHKKDDEIKRLLNQIDRLTAILDLSQKLI